MLFLLSNLLSLCPHYTAAEMQGTVGRTPPQSAVRTKSRQAKAPTHTGTVSSLLSQQLTQPIPHSRIDVFHSLLTCRKVT